MNFSHIHFFSDRAGVRSQQQCISPCLESFIRVDELKGLTKVRNFVLHTMTRSSFQCKRNFLFLLKVALNVYLQLFEIPLLDDTRTCYTNWTGSVLSRASCTEYVQEALSLLQEESTRASRYYSRSQAHIATLFKEIVVQQNLDFINGSVSEYVKNENKDGK